MSVRVLVVDDSSFFRRRITEILNNDSELEVIGQAKNGQEAVTQARALKPDVITMDIEMPIMNGIEAVRQIMSSQPTPIIMFSSQTSEGAKSTLEALDAGAADFMLKKFQDVASNCEQTRESFTQKVKSLGYAKRGLGRSTSRARQAVSMGGGAMASVACSKPAVSIALKAQEPQVIKGNYKILAIGASTGGPVAIQKVIEKLPADFPMPVLVIQHMPGTFTPIFSERMNHICRVRVKQAEEGDMLKPGTVYIAPGGTQMLVKRNGTSGRIYITEGDAKLNYKPSVDITFRSLATSQSCRDVLAIILTGMGSDGCEGARELKKGGATIWAQDEASCVVYGMPAAVAQAGLTDQVLSLDIIGDHISRSI